jgi:TatD DNase family protein
MRLVDSHCHLDGDKFAGDLEETIERARAAGVSAFVAVGTGSGPPDLGAGVRMAERFSGFYATAGVHPHDAAKADEAVFVQLRELSKHPKVVAIGEIGLDFHYDFSPRDVQDRVFEEQLAVAREADLPVVIHTREAWAETMETLRRNSAASGIMHCFTGGPREAEQALALGFHVSFGGVITFPRAGELREAARVVPDDRLLVETDAPYLAPVPYRGKRNEPAFMIETVRKLAEVRATTAAHIAAITTSNFERLCLQGVNTSGYTGETQ